jgi:selT/selW/selH-like putative selenoprotein
MGEFSVVVDGNAIWDKKAAGRFPEHQEILARIGP